MVTGAALLSAPRSLVSPDQLLRLRLLGQLACEGRSVQPRRFSAGRSDGRPAAGERGVGRARAEGSAGDAVTSGTRRQIPGTGRVNFTCCNEANFK